MLLIDSAALHSEVEEQPGIGLTAAQVTAFKKTLRKVVKDGSSLMHYDDSERKIAEEFGLQRCHIWCVLTMLRFCLGYDYNGSRPQDAPEFPLTMDLLAKLILK